MGRRTPQQYPQILALLCGLSLSRGALTYNVLHIVDLQKVLCPSDQGGADYADIPLSSQQLLANPYAPHVVTFLRSSGKRCIITYSLINEGGREWPQGPKVATLQAHVGRRLSADELSAAAGTEGAKASRSARPVGEQEDEEEGEEEEEEDESGADERRLSARRRGGGYSSPRRRSYSSYSSPRRRSYSSYSSPRRRSSASYQSPRRRSYSSYSSLSQRRRRTLVYARRRGAPQPSRPTAYVPPGGPSRYSSAGTGGSGYGYPNQQLMYGNYGGRNPGIAPYGYSGYSSYGHRGASGRSSAMLGLGVGMLAGMAISVGGAYAYNNYYMHMRLRNAHCRGYACCYGCDNSCYSSSHLDCDVSMNQQLYRDDLMKDSGFYPKDEMPFPLKLRIYSVKGTDYSMTGICPSKNCLEDNCSSAELLAALNTSSTADLFVTLTTLEDLRDQDRMTGLACRGCVAQAFLPVGAALLLFLSLLGLRIRA